MKNLFLILLIVAFSAKGQVRNNNEARKKRQDSLVDQYLVNCAEKYNYLYQMKKWQECLDNGLKKDSTIAYLWQQKAMPYFKARKYEVGMQYLDKAVKYDPKNWQPYRAFIKCIFAKTYKDAILDFEDCKNKYGNLYVMDHKYNFYIALCYLQLNEYQKAEKLLEDYINDIFKNRGGLEHHIAFFYNGIAKYEQEKWEEAIVFFNKAIKIYPNFSDAKYYKSICMSQLKVNQEEISKLFKQAKEDFEKGHTINEDNAIYETYPYQFKNYK
jgi:tetratricopeptide (TPR) repeat protein